MKRSVTLSLTPWWVYLFELPLGALLWLCILFHNRVNSVFRLFPLEILIGGVMVFLPVYFFRVVSVRYDMLREIGPFSSKDSTTLCEKKTLTVKKLPHGKLSIEVYGGAEDAPALSWVRSIEKMPAADYRMFHSTAFGGKRAIARIASLFGIPEEDCEKLAKCEHQFTNEDLSASSGTENDVFTLRIRFFKTIL